jgi:hypothetical protein
MKRLALEVFALLLILLVACAHERAAVKYVANDTQTLRLKLAQTTAKLAQSQLQAICTAPQQAFQKSIQDLDAEADKVKLENHWPKETAFNPDTLVFSEPTPATAIGAKPVQIPSPPSIAPAPAVH